MADSAHLKKKKKKDERRGEGTENFGKKVSLSLLADRGCSLAASLNSRRWSPDFADEPKS